jgi:hypothetical protein
MRLIIPGWATIDQRRPVSHEIREDFYSSGSGKPIPSVRGARQRAACLCAMLGTSRVRLIEGKPAEYANERYPANQ